MNLSAPTFVVFIISLVVAIIAVISGLGVFAFPVIGAFYALLIAYIILALGVLVKGL